MKKIKIMVCVLACMSLLLATGCGDSEKAPAIGAEDNSPVTVSMLQGSSQGLWYIIGTGIAEALNRSFEGSVVQLMPGTSTANAIRLGKNEVEFGITHTNTSFEAYNGTGQFLEKHEALRGIAVMYPSMAQFIVTDDINLKTFDEFIENKVKLNISIGAPGSGSYFQFERILEGYGLTIVDVEAWGCSVDTKGFGDIVEMFQSGALNACLVTTSAPSNEIVQIGTNNKVHMVSFNEDILAAMCDKYGYTMIDISKDAYNFMQEDLTTCATYTMLGASSSVDDATAYKMAKSLAENIDYLQTVHSAIKAISTESLLEGMRIPFHPGAEKYYKEAGLMD
ncbi:MAG: TAXI family TRAP transporter solute-binding subunit [Clostridia bacterium]|nr:TAXI family TRAP transporter solute-binding subunit [Clostridia bacterium]